jgi:hypothetical protein
MVINTFVKYPNVVEPPFIAVSAQLSEPGLIQSPFIIIFIYSNTGFYISYHLA